jgi:hypothetical protein
VDRDVCWHDGAIHLLVMLVVRWLSVCTVPAEDVIDRFFTIPLRITFLL